MVVLVRGGWSRIKLEEGLRSTRGWTIWTGGASPSPESGPPPVMEEPVPPAVVPVAELTGGVWGGN